MRGLYLLTLCLFLLPLPLRAADQPPVMHTLTMHGDAKMTGDWTHYPYTDPGAPKGGRLQQAAIGTFDTLNPFTLKGKAPQALGPGPSLVYDRLTDRSWDEPFTLYPLIASGWRVADDRSWITFYIDPRARFHDGTPITADDIKFSFETLRDHGRPNMRRVYKLVADVIVQYPHTITFKLGPDHDRETVMIMAMMPILSHAYWGKKSFDAATMEPGLGTGPYRVKSAEAGRRIVYERVPDYWAADLPTRRGLNNFNEIVYDYFRDESIAFQAFKSGNLNFRRESDLTQWANAYDFPSLKTGVTKREAVPHGRAETVRGFILNTRRPPFDDLNVRHALSLVFDFDWVNKNLFSGQLKRTTSFFPNTDLAASNEAVVPSSLRARMQQADTLLKSAGWVVKNGIRINAKTGKPLTFEILLGAPEDEKIALSFTRSLKKLGITARTRTLDVAAFRDRLNTYAYDALFYFWQSTLSPGGEQLLYWGCDARDQNGRFNYAGICSPKIDQLAAKIAQTTSRDELVKTTQELDNLLVNGYYVIPFGHLPKDLIVTNTQIKRPDFTPLYGVVPESWWMQPSASAAK